MAGATLTRVAYDGARRVEFRGEVLAAATTHRPGVSRWTETTVYLTHRLDESGGRGVYVVAKVGRSILAHRRTCVATDTRRLPAYLAKPGQGRRMACLDCAPQLDPPGPDVVVEVDRNGLFQADCPDALARVLFPGVSDWSHLQGMSSSLHRQLCDSDREYAEFTARQAHAATTEE